MADDFTTLFYRQLQSVLGGTNGNQFLALTMPGTILNPSDYAYDTAKAKPALVAEAESRLADQMFDIAQVSGSGNGQHVSSRYLQGLSTLVPKFDPMMATVKNRLRDFLNSPAPPDATVDGEPFTGSTLEELYFALYDSWLDKKSAWDQAVTEQKRKLSKEDFVEWYEGVAESQLALIDAAEGRLVSVFSSSDMKAILGALASGPGGEISEAVNQVLDIRLPSPSGGFVYPVDLSPSDWFLGLATDQTPVNLLDDPQFIAVDLAGRRQALQATISQVQTMITAMPPVSTLTTASTAVTTAQETLTAAQNTLVNQYAANTVSAVDVLISSGLAPTMGVLDKKVASVSKAMGEDPPATKATHASGAPLSDADLQKLLDGHRKVIDAQSGLVASAQKLADAGMNLASAQARTFGDLPAMLARLQSQLADVTALQSQLATTARNPAPAPVPARKASDVVVAAARKVISDAQSATSASTWFAGLYTTVKDQADAVSLYTASAAAYAAFIADALTQAANGISHAAAGIRQAASDASDAPDATVDKVKAAVDGAVNRSSSAETKPVLDTITAQVDQHPATVKSAFDAVDRQTTKLTAEAQIAVDAGRSAVSGVERGGFPTAPPSTQTDVVTAAVTGSKGITTTELLRYLAVGVSRDPGPEIQSVTAAAASSPDAARAAADAAARLATGYRTDGETSSTPSPAADRWMDLQFSLESSQMTSDRSSSSLSSATNWTSSLFFGSASRSSSSATSQVSQDSLSTDTHVRIGLKATKVDISRNWFDPGVFKLSRDMQRLTTVPISAGRIDPSKPGNANEAILPCFPVAFVVVKDVVIQFQVKASAMKAVQSVLDSRSAVGGGFLCFSAPSASAAHSDSSSLSTKTEGTTVTINMPGAQILGWFCEFTPSDQSTTISGTPSGTEVEQDIIQFVDALKRFERKAEPLTSAESTTASANGARPGRPVSFSTQQ